MPFPSLLIALALLASGTESPQPDAKLPFLLQFTHEVAETAGVGRLSQTPGSLGSEEIRVWVGFGVISPDHMLRLHRDASGKVFGELWIYFPNDLTSIEDLHERHRIRRKWTQGCAAVRKGEETDVCLAVFRKPPNWALIYTQLASLGVATLPDESSLAKPKTQVFDGVAMVVELQNDKGYRSYEYSNPIFREEPEAKAAAAIIEAVGDVINAHD